MSTPPIELDAAVAFLTNRYGSHVADISHLGGGDWSRAFSFQLDGRDLVARFGLHVEDFLKDQKAMSFAGPDLPVPTVLEIGDALGGYYAISERHYGEFLEQLDEEGWQKVTPALFRALDAMHELTPPTTEVDWATTHLPASGSWPEWLLVSLEDRPGRRTSGWRAAIDTNTEVAELFSAAHHDMCSLLGVCPDLRHVIHRDLLNRNVLVADSNSHLEAVFDWGCSLAGDYLYEVALLTFWSPWYPALESVDLRSRVSDHYAAIGLHVDNFEERLACYELHVGLEHIGYAAFTKRDDHLRDITRRTSEILEGRLPRSR